MPYNKEELFNLPVAEKYELVMDLWDRIENDLLNVTEEEIQFAKERLKLHRDNPSEGISLDELKKSISEKYGF
jgi:putative addiction module component (TIGR02574 family)